MTFSWRLELPQLALIAAMFAAAAVFWPRAPERIPVHWNAYGEIDRYGGKFEGLLLLPLITLGLYVLLLVIPRFDPGYANYRRFAKAYSVIRVALVIVMAVIYAVLLLSTFGYGVNMTAAILSVIGVLFLVLGNFMGKIRPNWFVGVRTPWTLSSKLSWTKTHRAAGWLFIGMGAVSILAGLIGTPWAVMAMMVICGASVVWMVVYSYLVWRNDPDRIPPAGTAPSDD